MVFNFFMTVDDKTGQAPFNPNALISCALEEVWMSEQVHENDVGSAPPRSSEATIPSRPSLAANLIKVDLSYGTLGFG